MLRWLSWLASRIVQEKQTIFLIEKMQPTWLKNAREESAYRIRTFLISWLSFGLIFGLISWLSFGPSFVKGLMASSQKVARYKFEQSFQSVLLNFELSLGLSFGLISGLITVLQKKISPLEQLSWSWQKAKSRFVRELFTGVGYGLSFALIFALSFGLGFGLGYRLGYRLGYGLGFGLIFGLIFALIFALIFSLCSGLGSSEIVQRTVPNQGIRTSRRNCLFIGLIVGSIVGSIAGLIVGLILWINNHLTFGRVVNRLVVLVLIFGSIAGLIAGLRYGGVACIQHFNLRWMLHQKGRIPWNYAKFLDFASDRRLMKRVGGGYVFFHRMLLEHFAQMNHN